MTIPKYVLYNPTTTEISVADELPENKEIIVQECPAEMPRHTIAAFDPRNSKFWFMPLTNKGVPYKSNALANIHFKQMSKSPIVRAVKVNF